MSTQTTAPGVRRTIQELLFHPDPTHRQLAADILGGIPLRIAEEGDALEALTTAMDDPAVPVKESAFQAMVRISQSS